MRTKLLAAVLTGLLVSCGGGGADDSKGAVSFEITGPTRIEVETYEGQMQTFSVPIITGRVKGDVSTLNGKTLYLIAVTSDDFFDTASPYVNADGVSGGVTVTRRAVVPDGVGTRTGTITIHACLDIECRTELPVSNATVPFSVRVKRGLHFGQTSVVFDTTFGATPSNSRVTVPVQLPDNTVSWSVQGNFYRSAYLVEKASDGSNAIVVSVNYLSPVGERETSALVEARTQDGTVHYRALPLTFTTRPNGQVYAFQWPQGDFVMPYGNSSSARNDFLGVMFTDASARQWEYRGTTYGPGNTLQFGWLWVRTAPVTPPYDSFSVEMSVQPCYGSNCLPVGTYTATVNYRYTPIGGVPVDVSYPVTFQVIP